METVRFVGKVTSQNGPEMVIKDVTVFYSIYITVNFTQSPHTIPCNASPDHNWHLPPSKTITFTIWLGLLSRQTWILSKHLWLRIEISLQDTTYNNFIAFILPSTLHKAPTPYHVMHPQIITDTFLWCGGHMDSGQYASFEDRHMYTRLFCPATICDS
jgi:hypothetical protein